VALDARCAHKRFPLWEGKLLDGDMLECAYHGFAYNPSGRCVAIPALHEPGQEHTMVGPGLFHVVVAVASPAHLGTGGSPRL